MGHSEERVLMYFDALSGERQLQTLPPDVVISLPSVCETETSAWKAARSWAKWWTKPSHLSMKMLPVAIILQSNIVNFA